MTTQQKKGQAILKGIIDEVSKVVVGKDDIKEILLLALLSQGHVLIEGLPGTAKTTVARTFAHAIGGTFKRVQGTPDMLPSDILGFYLYRADGSATFMPGPVFTNVLLADELNRTTPRTQSALLESMQEQQVTIERETHKLGQPFIVIASQIPYGGPGTSQLSEVQTDRFMFRTWSGLSTLEEEDQILRNIDIITEPHTEAVATPEDIVRLQQDVKEVHVADSIRRYILDIIDNLRHHQDVVLGLSTRAGISLLKGARARAFLQERDFVIPDDVKTLLVPALSHRLQVSPEAEMEDISPEPIINEVATQVPVPKIDNA
ncbi:MAG: MoxR family ATPase [Dehalococcoidales bacterium]|nr:MoxR family ATPase [Dehalococcoidales bacterium]